MASALELPEADLLDMLAMLSDTEDDATASLYLSTVESQPCTLAPLQAPSAPANAVENTLDTTAVAVATATDGAKPLAPTRQRLPRRRRHRKQDLEEMRAAVAALEHRLLLLRRSHQTPTELTLFWRRVAERLRRDRELAVTDNARLRSLLTEQSRVLKMVARALERTKETSQKVLREEMEHRPTTSTPHLKLPAIPAYEDMLLEAAQLLPRLDRVIQRSQVDASIVSMPPSNPIKRHVSARFESNGSQRPVVCIEIAESRVVPFGIHTIDATVWKHFSSHAETQLQRTEVWQTSGDSAFGRCTVAAAIGLHEFDGHVAVRRYRLDNRLAFVARGHCVCTNTIDPSSSFVFRDTVWVVLESSPLDPANRTIIRSFVQYQPSASEQDTGAVVSDLATLTPIALHVHDTGIAPIIDGVIARLRRDNECRQLTANAEPTLRSDSRLSDRQSHPIHACVDTS
ncbi:hypothetical protein PINS_up003392 [Pythium insidiosum]|nr:hypothetical protein PINS_up003392 [Pythium insidiosum]